MRIAHELVHSVHRDTQGIYNQLYVSKFLAYRATRGDNMCASIDLKLNQMHSPSHVPAPNINR